MITFSEMKRRNRAIGHYWFRKETMDYFGTHLEGYPTTLSIKPDIALFVSSEEDKMHYAWDGQRRFTVRLYEDGAVTTLGAFGQHQTRQAAEQAIQRMVRRIHEEGTPSWEMVSLLTQEATQK